MKEMYNKIYPIEIDRMDLAVKQFIEYYDQKNKFIMRVLVEFIFDESERRIEDIKDKEHLQSMLKLLFTYIEEKVVEEKPQVQQNNVPTVRTRQFGVVPIPEGYSIELVQALGDMVIDEIEYYYQSNPNKLPTNNPNNKEKIRFNLNALQNGSRYSNGNLRELSMRNKMDNNLGNRFGSINRGSGFNEDDYLFDVEKAIELYLQSTKLQSKVVIDRIIQLCLANRANSDDIIMNLQLYLASQQLMIIIQ